MPASSTFLVDLIVLLEGAGLSLTYGTNLFKGQKARLPSGAAAIVSLYRTGGRGKEGTHNAGSLPGYERPSAQIVARHEDYDTAEAMALALYAFLPTVQNQFVNGTWWREINVGTEPFDLPLDPQNRARQAFNISCVKRVSPATS